MTNKDFSITFIIDKSPADVFKIINDVPAWWSLDFRGSSKKTGDEFEVRFGDIHYSRQKIVEQIPAKKIVWLVTESQLNFLKNKNEWRGTNIIFEIAAQADGKTELHFTHLGLLPEIECFKNCSAGWNYYLKDSLLPMIETGKGQPNQKVETSVINQ